MFWVQSRKTWDLVRQRIFVGWVIGDWSNVTIIELVVPPTIALGSFTTGTLHDSLYGQRWHRAINLFIGKLRAMAVVAFGVRESDAHICCAKHVSENRNLGRTTDHGLESNKKHANDRGPVGTIGLNDTSYLGAS